MSQGGEFASRYEEIRTRLLHAGLDETEVPQYDTLLQRPVPKLQRAISREVDLTRFEIMKRECRSPGELAVLQSLATPGASRWMAATPCMELLKLKPQEVHTLWGLRLLFPFPPLLWLNRCACGEDLSVCGDLWGKHFLLCQLGGGWQRRHEALLQGWLFVLRMAGLKPQRGKQTLLSSLGLAEEGDHRSLDIVVAFGVKMTVLDITVSSPVQKNPDVARSVARELGAWADAAGRRKLRKYMPA